MPTPTPLPDISLVEAKFEYDPVEGVLYYKQTGTPCSNNDRSGQMKVRCGRKTTTVQRICWFLFYREDPGTKQILHIDDNPRNNRIENLRACK